jgi:hypothetical protein
VITWGQGLEVRLVIAGCKGTQITFGYDETILYLYCGTVPKDVNICQKVSRCILEKEVHFSVCELHHNPIGKQKFISE